MAPTRARVGSTGDDGELDIEGVVTAERLEDERLEDEPEDPASDGHLARLVSRVTRWRPGFRVLIVPR
jgi:hypothetical protein